MTTSGLDHDSNVIAAAAVLAGERIREAVENTTGTSGSVAAAVTALDGWANGAHIDALAGGLRLSQSRAVRVVTALEAQGLAIRESDPTDGRRSLVRLTSNGHNLASRARAARAKAITELLSDLNGDDQRRIAQLCERFLESQAVTRAEARAICRFCDLIACGHSEGRCPSTAGANLHER